ncbi:hypothetical protein [Thalassobacillus cyri]|uniref:hypothetical protein n=1 Tax=Thalassobacillus cyri TaxID=571932 RepID=UPI000AC369F8
MVTTVFLTTQYLEEADQLADLIGDRGVLIAEGTSTELKSSIGVRSLIIDFEDEQDLDQAESIFD